MLAGAPCEPLALHLFLAPCFVSTRALRPYTRAATKRSPRHVPATRSRDTRPGIPARSQGRHTASGTPYDPAALTAAHRSLPFGTLVRVTRLDTGRSVTVVINDRGPFGNARRVIDLSHSAAAQLGMLGAGVVPVQIEVVAVGHDHYRRHL